MVGTQAGVALARNPMNAPISPCGHTGSVLPRKMSELLCRDPTHEEITWPIILAQIMTKTIYIAKTINSSAFRHRSPVSGATLVPHKKRVMYIM